MFGQSRDSIYDQLDETQLYNEISDETQVYNDLVDYTTSSAGALSHSDQPEQQAEHRSKLVMRLFTGFHVFRYLHVLFLIIWKMGRLSKIADTDDCDVFVSQINLMHCSGVNRTNNCLCYSFSYHWSVFQ
jgi:hypothetical protein